MNRFPIIASIAAAALVVGCSEKPSESAGEGASETVSPTTPEPAGDAVVVMAEPLDGWEGVNNLFSDGSFYFSGQPDEASFKRLAEEEGVVTVVNIRQASEVESLAFDEQAVVEGLGMVYVHIPVSPGSFSAEDVGRFAAAVEASDGPVLLQCASSNRVGGMWAAYLVMERGMEMEAALELGRAAGLSRDSMVEAVHRIAGELGVEDGGGG